MAGTDQRDSRTWVVLELSRHGESKVEEGTLPGLLREALEVDSKFPVFIPAATYMSGNKRTTIHLMEGYAFVSTGLAETRYLALESTPYVRRVLTQKAPTGMRVLSVIPETSIQDLKFQLSKHVATDVAVGMRVSVSEGVFAHLEGEVLVVEDTTACVSFPMRSANIITAIPLVLLTPIDDVWEAS